MSGAIPAPRTLPLAGLPLPVLWAVLVALSIVTTIMLEWAQLPAAQMLGPMVAGIILESCGGTVGIPRSLMNFVQAVIGCLIARSFTPEIFAAFGKQWPLFLGVVAMTLIASVAFGWAISKIHILQGTTAVWGLLPGAASVMILMADAFGADVGLVAFMQYLRVVFVAITASLIARFWVQRNAADYRCQLPGLPYPETPGGRSYCGHGHWWRASHRRLCGYRVAALVARNRLRLSWLADGPVLHP